MRGIDVSHWQGNINWEQVKKDKVEFAIIKCTESLNFVDDKFKKNKEEARKAGILCGFYHFARGNEATKEADFFLSKVGDLQEGESLVLDYEIHIPNEVAWCKKFLDRVTEKAGFRPMIYINSSTAKSLDWSPVVKGNYGLWIANYGPNDGAMNGNPEIGAWPFYAIWQYTSVGKISGISGKVDINYTPMDIKTLKRYGKPKEEVIDYKKLYEEEKIISSQYLERIKFQEKEKEEFKNKLEKIKAIIN